MSKNKTPADRYRSFSGITCNLNADRLIAILDSHISSADGDPKWQGYFTQKRELQIKLQHDNLNFIGNQTNTLYEYFLQCNDQTAQALLYQIEQECC